MINLSFFLPAQHPISSILSTLPENAREEYNNALEVNARPAVVKFFIGTDPVFQKDNAWQGSGFFAQVFGTSLIRY